MRVGIGFDTHRLVEGRPLWLGGVNIPFKKGLEGHSDADVLVHAIIDALLGAAALGNIGQFFPDTDPQYKDISSIILLEKTKAVLDEKDYFVENVDSIVILEEPRLQDYWQPMLEAISKALNIKLSQISIKAKTSEEMGSIGRKEGIAAMATALLKYDGYNR